MKGFQPNRMFSAMRLITVASLTNSAFAVDHAGIKLCMHACLIRVRPTDDDDACMHVAGELVTCYLRDGSLTSCKKESSVTLDT